MKLFGRRVGGYCFDCLSGFHEFGAFDSFRGFDGFAFVHRLKLLLGLTDSMIYIVALVVWQGLMVIMVLVCLLVK